MPQRRWMCIATVQDEVDDEAVARFGLLAVRLSDELSNSFPLSGADGSAAERGAVEERVTESLVSGACQRLVEAVP